MIRLCKYIIHQIIIIFHKISQNNHIINHITYSIIDEIKGSAKNNIIISHHIVNNSNILNIMLIKSYRRSIKHHIQYENSHII